MLRRSTFREIGQSLGRYLAILAIVALGVGFFSGLKVTKADMVSTTNGYLQEHKFFDYELISTLGFDDDSVASVAEDAHVRTAEGAVSADAIVNVAAEGENVYHAMTVTKTVNTLKLTAGRMPESADECVLDAKAQTKQVLGKYLTVSDANSSDTAKLFKYRKYKVVGLVDSPLYLNFQRGATSLGNGSVTGFFCIPKTGFAADAYTEIYVRLKKSGVIYSEEYKSAVSDAKSAMKAAAKAATAARYDGIVSAAKAKLAEQQKKYEDGYASYLAEKKAAYAKLNSAAAKIDEGERELDRNQSALAAQKKTLTESQAKIAAGLEQTTAAWTALEEQKPGMTAEQIATAEAQLTEQEQTLRAQQAAVEAGLAKVSSGEQQLTSSRKTLAANRASLKSSRSQADSKFAAAAKTLEEGRAALEKAENRVEKLKRGSSYAFTRSINTGYVSFDSDSSIVNGIARVFPVFFFMVAALVCMTTMTRMVEEQRSQIGVLKALGYSNRKVMGKYLFYSGSAASVGAVLGFFAGCRLFPVVIWKAYGMMYSFEDHVAYLIDWKLGAVSLAVALICSMGATWFSCAEDFRVAPAELIRPKAPKSGKRILLERISPLWNRIGFLHKVSLRNIFRYKKRFFMMVLGICGCTALLIAGFGINDTIKDIANLQFREIDLYDYSVTFDKNMTAADQTGFLKYSGDDVKDALFVHASSVTLVKGGKQKSISLIASDGETFGKFISLHSGREKIAFPGDGEAVICKKLSNQYHLKKGQQITLRDKNYHTMKVRISGICDNYVNDFLYLSTGTYASGFGTAPSFKLAYVIASGSSSSVVHKAAAQSAGYRDAAATSVNSDVRDLVNNMMQSLNAVIVLVVLCAGALAFIVIYNLTNINITERIREIATIKVLGFYHKETMAYVFRENLFMTAISALVGIPLGKVFLTFVMSQINVDLIYFSLRITPRSYVLSVILTFVFAVIVGIPMSGKLRRVSMTESLKSVE